MTSNQNGPGLTPRRPGLQRERGGRQSGMFRVDIRAYRIDRNAGLGRPEHGDDLRRADFIARNGRSTAPESALTGAEVAAAAR